MISYKPFTEVKDYKKDTLYFQEYYNDAINQTKVV